MQKGVDVVVLRFVLCKRKTEHCVESERNNDYIGKDVFKSAFRRNRVRPQTNTGVGISKAILYALYSRYGTMFLFILIATDKSRGSIRDNNKGDGMKEFFFLPR